MLRRFQYSVMAKGFSSNATRMASAMKSKIGISNTEDGQDAFNRMIELCEQKHYLEALKEMDLIEKKYPAYTKEVKYYRGEASYELLEMTGKLQKPRPAM